MSAVSNQLQDDWRFVFAKTGRAKVGLEQQPPSASVLRQTLLSAVRRKPQVMVKITSFSSSAKQLGAHLDYISRNGDNEVFDHQGVGFSSIGDRVGLSTQEAMHAYGRAIASVVPKQNGEGARRARGRPRKRVSMNLMLSMPAGTDTGAFELAVRDFLNDQFQAHDRLFTFHDDRDHYHAHVVIGLQGTDGRWLNPRKHDLLAWRERFASSLERHGIPAEALPAYSRGKGKDGYRRDLHELSRRGTREGPSPSPSYEAETEARAIRRRAEAWTRIADHYAAHQDHEAANAIRDYVADHYDYQPEPGARQAPGQGPTPKPPTKRRNHVRDQGRER
ncbi:relaxase/mobilization nuclease domain-containing protein [Halochromatium roseum]|uniref:relaxase/mobilization nuclease domain-containing protein n=1 Tax=Halochromatium roseum TaxID=391920 RepID=UPI001912CB6E|nr:hypothetical protein [Halochromatium roseum]MBK5938051.1 hypothetical protein [Halochromatium roseum]